MIIRVREFSKILIQIVFLLGIFLKQFYIFPSGGLQLGDICLFCSCCGVVFIDHRITFRKEDLLLLIFFLLIVCVNTYYSIAENSTSFMRSSLYYFYNFVIAISFSKIMNSTIFLKRFLIVLKCCVLTQCLILLLGLGKWYSSVRYMGTFNDPNQYAFFVFSTAILILLISDRIDKGYSWFWVIFCTILIVPSASTGVLLGILFLLSGGFVINYRKRSVLVLFFLIILVLVFIALLNIGVTLVPDFIKQSFIYERVMDKLALIGYESNNAGISALLEERGWERLIQNPQYIIFGAGEGEFTRFGSGMEIHSSIFSIIFYYGIIPFSIISGWIINKFRQLEKNNMYIILALIVESIFLNNLRQPFFWLIFCLCSREVLNNNNEELIKRLE